MPLENGVVLSLQFEHYLRYRCASVLHDRAPLLAMPWTMIV
jgi:hypothetical protein